MSEFNIGDKVIAIAYRTNFETNETIKRKVTAEIVEKDSLGCYRLTDDQWYTEEELALATKYQEQKSKLNV